MKLLCRNDTCRYKGELDKSWKPLITMVRIPWRPWRKWALLTCPACGNNSIFYTGHPSWKHLEKIADTVTIDEPKIETQGKS